MTCECSFKQGQEYPLYPNTGGTIGYTCPHCGMFVYYNTYHICVTSAK
jgi:hypothetical protein